MIKHRIEHFKSHVVRPENGNAFRVLVIRCACGITINTSWRYAKAHWSKHVHVMREAAT